MAFASFEKGEEIEANAEINMVPFIDVMLVLLIIFMITAPLMSHAVKVDLPKAATQPLSAVQKPVDVVVNAAGEVRVNGDVVALSGLQGSLAKFPAETEVHLRADRGTPYELIARVLAASAGAGLAKIGFVTDLPQPG